MDVYVAGPPCQPWSRAGVKKGAEDHKGKLLFRPVEYAERQKPKVVLLENVANVAHCFMNELDELVERLKKAGYVVHWKLLDTQFHGLPQARSRLWIVAIQESALQAPFEFPKDLEWCLHPDQLLEETDDTGAKKLSATALKNIKNATHEVKALVCRYRCLSSCQLDQVR